jgi:hypothetical protein
MLHATDSTNGYSHHTLAPLPSTITQELHKLLKHAAMSFTFTAGGIVSGSPPDERNGKMMVDVENRNLPRAALHDHDNLSPIHHHHTFNSHVPLRSHNIQGRHATYTTKEPAHMQGCYLSNCSKRWRERENPYSVHKLHVLGHVEQVYVNRHLQWGGKKTKKNSISPNIGNNSRKQNCTFLTSSTDCRIGSLADNVLSDQK